MNLIEHFRRQFAYNGWANREVRAAAEASTKSIGRSRELLAHIVSAERLWFERVRKQRQSLPVWPDFSLEQSSRQIDEINGLWQVFLSGLSPSELEENVSYTNSKGEQFTNSMQDIFTHVLLHSAYHRGQIASEMRRHGEQPAYTDFIHAVRQGTVK
jgi:uncharacterized damage-inducible protein DinB